MTAMDDATMNQSEHEVTIAQEIADTSGKRPHLLLLGAGASRAALPNGDKYGRQVPLLQEVAAQLNLIRLFPPDLQALATDSFEAAYSRLADRNPDQLAELEDEVRGYFARLQLPDAPNLYDTLNLSLRSKDVIASFNWDPLLIQSQVRLAGLGMAGRMPRLLFLHGNVLSAGCAKDMVLGRIGTPCPRCGKLLMPTKLLFPVEHKDYQSDPLIRGQWSEMQTALKYAQVFTIFGYSAPVTDKEAVDLLKQGWGSVDQRNLEQTEVINRPGSNEEAIRKTWKPFIHSHHYDIFDDFYESFLANHPRRSIEAYWNQYIEAKFITPNPIPKQFRTLHEAVAWFRPHLEVEDVEG